MKHTVYGGKLIRGKFVPFSGDVNDKEADFRTNFGLEITARSLSLNSSSTSASTSLSKFDDFDLTSFLFLLFPRSCSDLFGLDFLDFSIFWTLMLDFDLFSNNFPIAWPKIVDLKDEK